MNRIVKKHYPASQLPKDLRDGLDPSSQVRITIEEERANPTSEELTALLLEARKKARGITTEEAVARIRELRDEWDD